MLQGKRHQNIEKNGKKNRNQNPDLKSSRNPQKDKKLNPGRNHEAGIPEDLEKEIRSAQEAQFGNYLALLRGFVQGTKPEFPDLEQLDWNALLKVAAINKTIGILGYMIMTYPEFADEQMRRYGRSLCISEITEYSQRGALMEDLIVRLDQAGIDHLLFKGFVVRRYYDPPEMRTFSDIDIVIRKEDRDRCHAFMKELGYMPHYDWEPAYSYIKGSEYYEIHSEVLEVDVSDKADYRSYYSHFWEYARKVSEDDTSHSYEFTPEFHFLYLLTHIAKHLSVSGAGIRMYLDLAMFIRHFGDSLDWKWVEEQLAVLKFEDFANISLSGVERWFGVSSPIELRPLNDEVMDDFTLFTLEAGLFGKFGRDQSTVFLKQQNRNEQDVSRFKTLMHHAFPPVRSLEDRYSYLQKHHFLLPFAWVHRIIDNRDSWKRYRDTAKGIMNADDAEVLRLKRMYKEIGL